MNRTRGGQDAAQHDDGPDGKRTPPSERRWIWFRSQSDGRSPALEEFRALDVNGRAGLTKKMQRYRDGQSRRQDVDHLGDGLYELRSRHGSDQFRLLFTFWGPHLVALTAFQKKQAKTPKVEHDRARGRARRWREVFGTEPPPATGK